MFDFKLANTGPSIVYTDKDLNGSKQLFRPLEPHYPGNTLVVGGFGLGNVGVDLPSITGEHFFVDGSASAPWTNNVEDKCNPDSDCI
jgi:hypothetical protein